MQGSATSLATGTKKDCEPKGISALQVTINHLYLESCKWHISFSYTLLSQWSVSFPAIGAWWLLLNMYYGISREIVSIPFFNSYLSFQRCSRRHKQHCLVPEPCSPSPFFVRSETLSLKTSVLDFAESSGLERRPCTTVAKLQKNSYVKD